MKVAQRVTGVPIAPGVGALGWGQRWDRLINDDERRRRDTYCAATIELCVAPPGSIRSFALPRAHALGRGKNRIEPGGATHNSIVAAQYELCVAPPGSIR